MKSPNEWVADPRFEGARHWLSRYHPFITTVIAIALIAVLLPGRSSETNPEGVAENLAGSLPDDTSSDITPSDVIGPATTDAATPQAAAPVADTNVLGFEEARKQGVALVPNCDQNTGRIKIPSRFAPPCTQKYGGRNAGASWQGVTDKEIKVVYYEVVGDPASEAILTAANANDSPEEVRQQVLDWGKYFESHYNLWGRKVKWVFVTPSGDAQDDAAGKSDAIKIATEIKAFAAVNSQTQSYVNELVARKVMCFCTVSLPIETYIKWSPYVWTTLLASTQGYIHRGDYIARIAGKKAQWAYDQINPTQDFKSQNRRFGFLYYDTDDLAYKSGADFFIKYMKEKYGVAMTSVSQYHGYPQVSRTQEEARPIIQKFKEAGVNAIICSCDPFGPIFFTQEATRQLYGPEWILTGSALTDTSFFARLYDQDQWAHAYGVSYLGARTPEELGDPYRLYFWQFNKEPAAPAGYGVIYAPIRVMYNGFHLAGGALTPETFRSGMYSQPITGRGGITTIASSFGDKGLWPWKEDPVAADDATEVWWDRNAEGEDELGTNGRGLYRYPLGGKRYLPGEWPKSLPVAFDPKGTVTIYTKPPPQDAWPCYPSPATKKNDRC